MPFTEHYLWSFLLVGYLTTILIETPILCVGLSKRHSLSRRLLAGLWLTACTYPIVILVLPTLLYEAYGEGVYVLVAEIFAPLAECLLFLCWMRRDQQPYDRRSRWQDMATIVAANLASFLFGEWWFF